MLVSKALLSEGNVQVGDGKNVLLHLCCLYLRVQGSSATPKSGSPGERDSVLEDKNGKSAKGDNIDEMKELL